MHGTRTVGRAGAPAYARSINLCIPKLGVVVPRPRLYDSLTRGVRHPIVVVNAPAGYGKTTLAAAWVASDLASAPIAWVTLNAADNDPKTFWAHVLRSLQLHAGPCGVDTAARSAGHQGKSNVIADIEQWLARRHTESVLVLDQCERVTSRSVWSDLTDLVFRSGRRLRLVLLTRRIQSAWAGLLPTAHSEGHLGARELAFTLAETSALCSLQGLGVDPPALVALQRHVQGWAMGLVLAAPAIREEPDATSLAAERALGSVEVARYLVEEVLTRQPLHVQDFLLRTSVADALSPVLARRLSGRRDASVILNRLCSDNVMLAPLEHLPGHYAYHPLFRQVLRDHLRTQRPRLEPLLLRRAAVWATHRPDWASEWQRDQAVWHCS